MNSTRTFRPPRRGAGDFQRFPATTAKVDFTKKPLLRHKNFSDKLSPLHGRQEDDSERGSAPIAGFRAGGAVSLEPQGGGCGCNALYVYKLRSYGGGVLLRRVSAVHFIRFPDIGCRAECAVTG